MSLLPVSLLIAFLAAAGVSQSSAEPTNVPFYDSALRLRIVRDTGITYGTCVLVHRETRADGVVLYFVTAAHLFKSPMGEAPSRARAINVVLDDTHAIAIDPADLLLPGGDIIDLAVLRAVVTQTTLMPQAMLFEPPGFENVFLIAGRDRDGVPVTIAQRVRRRASALVVGDRDASGLVGCEGAPAVGELGVFGIVSECAAGRAPVVTLFSIARDWISRHIPGLSSRPPMTTEFSVFPRDIPGPLLVASCGEEKHGEVDVPFALAADEMAVDATASLLNRTALHLGDVTVLKFADSSVKLRFTLTGAPRPQPPAAPCPQEQALVNVRVTVAKVRR
jgi:hypothetical protein